VDPASPAEAAGLREGDRIVAVNGVDVADGTHQDVVRRIRADPDRVELLVVDAETDEYFKQRGVNVSTSMTDSAVQRIVCPSDNIHTDRLPSTAPIQTSHGARYFAGPIAKLLLLFVHCSLYVFGNFVLLYH